VLMDLDAGRLRLPERAELDLVDLVRGDGEAGRVGLPPEAPNTEIARAADERIRRWKVLEGHFQLAVARVARTVREAFEAIYYSAG
jgi:hypothetical protein